MKKILFIVLMILLFFGLTPSMMAKELEIVGESAILIEENTGEILFDKNKNEKMYPASTTKIMTALIALEYGELEEIVEVGPEIEWISGDSSKANLYLGQEIKLRDLLYGLILPSGNDAANSIAVHIGKKVKGNQGQSPEEALEEFVELMNQKAAEIGAKNTHFVNPHGYHDEDHYTAPLDLAIITKEAMKHDVFQDIIKTTNYEYTYQDENSNVQEGIWQSYNELILENSQHYFPYACGVKSGRTSKAGRCLVSSAIKDELHLIAVVLKSTEEDVWSDSTTLLSYGLDHYKYYTAPKGQGMGRAKVKNAHPEDQDELHFILGNDVGFLIQQADEPNIETKIYLDGDIERSQEKSSLRAPIEKGEVIGKVSYLLNGEILGEEKLIAENTIRRKSLLLSHGWIFLVFLLLVVLILRFKKK